MTHSPFIITCSWVSLLCKIGRKDRRFRRTKNEVFWQQAKGFTKCTGTGHCEKCQKIKERIHPNQTNSLSVGFFIHCLWHIQCSWRWRYYTCLGFLFLTFYINLSSVRAPDVSFWEMSNSWDVMCCFALFSALLHTFNEMHEKKGKVTRLFNVTSTCLFQMKVSSHCSHLLVGFSARENILSGNSISFNYIVLCLMLSYQTKNKDICVMLVLSCQFLPWNWLELITWDYDNW